MDQETYFFINWLHIVSAAVLIGGLAVFPFLRTGKPRPEAQAVVRDRLAVQNRFGNLLVIPSLLVIFVTGLLMTVGPFAIWNMFHPTGAWALFGLMIWAVAAAVIGFLLGVVKQMLPLAGDPDGNGERLGRLSKQHRWALALGLLLLLLAEWVMVYRPTP